VGAKVPSADSLRRIDALRDSQPLRDLVCDLAHRLQRNKALIPHEGWSVAAVDGHEFFSRRQRCGPDCPARTLPVAGEKVTESSHQGVVCHRIVQDLALVWDVEGLRPGEGEETASQRLLERVFTPYPRFVDVVVGDALDFHAPFLNLCLNHQKHALVTAQGENRLVVQDAAGWFAPQPPGRWVDEPGKRAVPAGRSRTKASPRWRRLGA
jgi:hypothetical protein